MRRLAASIPGGRQILVEGTGHDIHVDEPGILTAPVLEMIDEVRRARARPAARPTTGAASAP
jgi:pimeloyl-ACP methyl ester carboxylesterase